MNHERDMDSAELYALAIEAGGQLLGPQQRLWLDRLGENRERLESLLDGFITGGDTERALTLAGALSPFWWMRGHTAAGRERVGRALALPGGSAAARAAALVGAGSLAYAAADFRRSRTLYEQALPLLRATGKELDLARALDRAGMAARQQMELEQAQGLHAEALHLLERVGTAAQRALCLNNLGVVAFFRGDLGAAEAYHRRALALRQACGDVRGQASSLNNLGQVARFAGDLPAARACMEQGLALRRQLGDPWGVAGSQVNLAVVHARRGDYATARRHLGEALSGFRRVGDPLGLCECLEAGAELAHAEGRLADAVAFWAAAALRRERLPAPLSLLHGRALADLLGAIRAALGEEGFAASWREGQDAGDLVLERLAGGLEEETPSQSG
jgi:tetratricopeptide (TPR) repeat protein